MSNICVVGGCLQDSSKSGYCNAHYLRLRRNGTTDQVRKVGRDKCTVDDCERDQAAKGLCNKHYSRMLRTGDPLQVITTVTGEPHLYYKDVVLTYDGDDCLEWPYGKHSKGYGHLWDGARPIGVHAHASNTCGRASCCNHKHIRWATPMENNADKKLHGTSQRGAINGNSKLTETKVLEIKELLKKSLPQCEIARLFSVSQKTIWMILHGKSWSHVTT